MGRFRRKSRGGPQAYFSGGEPNGMQPGDDIGNRRSFKTIAFPPEDLGNRKDPDEEEWVPEDNVGNRIDSSPTHELSGVLMSLDGPRRRRRPKGVSAPERVGRYLVGGVNPLVNGTLPKQPPPRAEGDGDSASFDGGGERRDDGYGGRRDDGQQHGQQQGQHGRRDDSHQQGQQGRRDDGQQGRRERGPEAPRNGVEQRPARFFDFDEDDRFAYVLKSTPEKKRKDAEEIVAAIVKAAGRDAVIAGALIDDGARPKVLVTIDDKGPSSTLPAERRPAHAGSPLFVTGSPAWLSLQYLVNKVVNRYPDDRIRLAVFPKSDEQSYLTALAEHRAKRGEGVPSAAVAAAPLAEVAPAPAPARSAPPPAPVVVPAPAPDVDDVVMEEKSKTARAKKAPKETAKEPPAKKESAAPKRAKKEAAKEDAPAAKAPAKKVRATAKKAAVEVVRTKKG